MIVCDQEFEGVHHSSTASSSFSFLQGWGKTGYQSKPKACILENWGGD